MKQIRKIKPYKSRFLVELYSEDILLLYHSDIKKYELYEDAEISDEKWETLMKVLYNRAKERALYLLDNSYKTEHQIREKLHLGYYPENIIEQVLKFLIENNFVNDYRYACLYIDYKRAIKSRRQIMNDLYGKGVSKDLIEQALEESEFSDTDSLIHLIEKRKNHYDLSDQKQLQKFYRYLISKGYHYNEVKEALNHFTMFDIEE